MYFSRLSEITEQEIQAGPVSWWARHISVSYQNIETLVGLIDAILIVLSSVAGTALYEHIWQGEFTGFDVSLGIGVTNSLIYVYVARSRGLYRLPVLLDPSRYLGRICLAWASVGLLLTALLFVLKVGSDVSRGAMITFGFLQITLLLAARWIEERFVRAAMATGELAGRRVVTVGETSELQRLGAPYLLRYFGLKEVARIALTEAADERFAPDIESLNFDRALNEARELGAEEFVVALRWGSRPLLECVRDRLRASPLPVRLLPDHNIRSILGRRSLSTGGPFLSLELQRAPLTRAERAVKRLMDIILGSVAIILLSPIFIATAIAIKLDSRGPIIFRQRRNGFNAHQFVIFKFRSMTVMEDGATIRQAQRGDRRVTRVGQILRASSIDELPQLFNVVKGDMSLVGPRPHALAHDNEYKALIAEYAFRHHVKPGMTGWAQVNGLRGETGRLEQMIERVKLDLWYINHWSLSFDVSIMLRTCFEVIRNRAY